MRKLTALLLFCLAGVAIAAVSAQQNATAAEPYTVEYYYRVKWGHQQEFIRLFKKNHLPLLQDDLKTGRAVSVTAVEPVYHASEESRWDYRVTIVFRDVNAAHSTPDDEPIVKRLFPDQEAFKREEQRRFEILEAHWDVPVKPVALK